jgi:DNA-binding CsgD family transcriptional regulator
MSVRPLSATELARLLEAERQGGPFLAYRDGAGDLCVLALTGRDHLTVGRLEQNDLELGWDPQVSRTHAEFERVGATWVLSDEGLSRNGSFVNNERISGRHRLKEGDVVRVGRTSLVFRAPGPPSDSTVAADPAMLVRLTDAERRVLTALCRPFAAAGESAIPATNRQIADELHLSPAGVKKHIRRLFEKLDIADLPQYQKRTELAQRALQLGLVHAA